MNVAGICLGAPDCAVLGRGRGGWLGRRWGGASPRAAWGQGSRSASALAAAGHSLYP